MTMTDLVRYRLCAQLITAANANSEWGNRMSMEKAARIIALCYPSDGTMPNVDAIFTTHVTEVLDTAENSSWCMEVHEYLMAAWHYHDDMVTPDLLAKVRIDTPNGEMWHWPATGMAYNDSADDAECDAGWDTGERISHCPCGHQCNEHCRRPRYYNSMRGHNFHTADGNPRAESCITCGAEYSFTVDEDEYASLFANNGDAPQWCTGRTDMVHGIERHCEADNGQQCAANEETGVCEHTDHDCNCGLCA